MRPFLFCISTWTAHVLSFLGCVCVCVSSAKRQNWIGFHCITNDSEYCQCFRGFIWSSWENGNGCYSHSKMYISFLPAWVFVAFFCFENVAINIFFLSQTICAKQCALYICIHVYLCTYNKQILSIWFECCNSWIANIIENNSKAFCSKVEVLSN